MASIWVRSAAARLFAHAARGYAGPSVRMPQVQGSGIPARRPVGGTSGIVADVEVVPHRHVASCHDREGQGRILILPEATLRGEIPRLERALRDAGNAVRI